MNSNKPIGGYFELELCDNSTIYHDDAILLNSGRTSLEYILKSKIYEKIYIPYYTCDVTLQPLIRQGIDYEFYHLDRNFLPIIESIGMNEVLLYVNYFGLMNKKIEIISTLFNNVIVDNSQAFYSRPIKNIPTFYSPRKFFGVPDGGFVYTNSCLEENLEPAISKDRISHLIIRIEEGPAAGYNSFKENEDKFNCMPLKRMSKLTNSILRNIDFIKTRKIRNENFNFLHEALKDQNEFSIYINTENLNGPMIYPYLIRNGNNLRTFLIENKIFTASYWPNLSDLVNENTWEYYLSKNLVALPIDQRYNLKDMNVIIDKIKCY